jgi:hypothetical protein
MAPKETIPEYGGAVGRSTVQPVDAYQAWQLLAFNDD